MKAEVRLNNGKPTIFLDGKPEVPVLFFGNTDMGRNVTAQAALAGNAGIHLHSCIYNLHFENEIPAQSPELNDVPSSKNPISDLYRSLDLVLNGDPDGRILLRVKVGAYFRTPPDEWKDEILTFADGSIYPEGSDLCIVSTSSEKWADAVDKKLTEIVKCIRENEKYRDHVIGFHLENCEWFEYGFRESGSDVSNTADRAFAKWQKEKYGNGYIPFPVPRDLPNNISSQFYPETLLLNEDEQRFVDYFDFINDLVSSRIERFAKTVKEASENDFIVIAFYGYLFELADCQSGHYKMEKLLRSPYLDGFAGPVSYGDRTASAPHGAVGATSAYMTVMDSAARNGKLWFQESDQRTTVNNSPDIGWLPGTDSVKKLFNIHKREVGDILLHGCAMWAMDLCDTGWLMDADIWSGLSRLCGFYREYAGKKSSRSSFDVIFVIDEAAESIVGQPSFNGISGNLISSFRFQAYRSGISFGFAEINDVADGLFDDAKLFVFLNPYRISHSLAVKLKKQLVNRKAVWMFGFGTSSFDDIKDITGMTPKVINGGSTGIIPDKDSTFSSPELYNITSVRYTVSGGDNLGVYDTGESAIVRCGNNWFWGGTSLGVENMRAFAELSGCHVYTEGNDVFLTDGNFAVFGAMEAGKKVLRFNSGRIASFNTDEGETLYFDLKNEERIDF